MWSWQWVGSRAYVGDCRSSHTYTMSACVMGTTGTDVAGTCVRLGRIGMSIIFCASLLRCFFLAWSHSCVRNAGGHTHVGFWGMCVRMHVRMYVRMLVRMCVHMCVHMCVRMHVHMRVGVHACWHADARVCPCVCVRACEPERRRVA